MNITPDFPILYEDHDLLIIDKPAGVVVNRAESVKEETVQDWAEQKIKNQKSKIQIEKSVILGSDKRTTPESDPLYPNPSDFYTRSGIVHRLDKETSGCLIIAKNPESFAKLQAAFKEHLVKKNYTALVHGKLVPETGEVNAPVGRLPWNREQFGIVPGGKESVTKYKVLKHYQANVKHVILASPAKAGRVQNPDSGVANAPQNDGLETFSLVELYPETGRTHQIRVHMKYLGFPLVGDYLYAGRKQQRSDREWCPRVFLHAGKIEFPHPATQQMIRVEVSLPEDLKQVLASLGLKNKLEDEA